jgi:hypothetical protein
MEKNDLFGRLQSLKDQLDYIGENYENQIGKMAKQRNIGNRLENKLVDLEGVNNLSNRIVIDACGRTFETTKATVANCTYENLLTKEIGKEGEVKVHLDIPRNYFKHLIAMVRYFQKGENLVENELFFVELEEKKDNLINFKKCCTLFFTDPSIIKQVKIIKVKPKQRF